MADGISYERARRFRRSLTPPEARLWWRLKAHRLGEMKFRRQHPIGPYILDFYCAAAKLAVEVDGAVHGIDAQIAHDERRAAWLAKRSIKVIRLPARAIRDELDEVLEFIWRSATSRV